MTPATASTLYFPVRVTSWPDSMLAAISANIIGVMTAPLSVADRPTTPWMKSGIKSAVPNMPIDMHVAAAAEDQTTRGLKSAGGISASTVFV